MWRKLPIISDIRILRVLCGDVIRALFTDTEASCGQGEHKDSQEGDSLSGECNKIPPSLGNPIAYIHILLA